MKKYTGVSTMKDIAKDKLSGFHSSALQLLVLSSVLTLSATTAVDSFFSGKMITSLNLGFWVAIIISIFMGIMKAGVQYGYLKIYCGERASIADLFYGYNNNSKDFLIISGLSTAITELMFTLMRSRFSKYVYSKDLIHVKWIMIILVVLLILMFVVVIPLSQSTYLLIDFPELNWWEAFRKSYSLMKGQSGRFFGLLVSFLPLLLLCVLTLGIGYFFVSPYIQMSLTVFYMNLVDGDEA